MDAEIRRYGTLLKDAEYAGQDFAERMNLDSEHIFYGKAEPYLAQSEENKAFQLMRVGYYKKCVDEKGKLVLSEIVSLKDEDIISTSGGNGIDMPDINIEGEGREI